MSDRSHNEDEAFRQSLPDERNASIGGRLALSRERLGKLQKDFAAAMGVSLRTYVGYERGESSPNLQNLSHLPELDLNWITHGVQRTGSENPDGVLETAVETDAEVAALKQRIDELEEQLSAHKGPDGRLVRPFDINMMAGVVAAVYKHLRPDLPKMSAAEFGREVAENYLDIITMPDEELEDLRRETEAQRRKSA